MYQNGVHPGLFNADQHYSSTAGDSFQYTFTGTGVSYFAPKSNDIGISDIYLDGVLVKSGVDGYAPSLISQQLLYYLDKRKDEVI